MGGAHPRALQTRIYFGWAPAPCTPHPPHFKSASGIPVDWSFHGSPKNKQVNTIEPKANEENDKEEEKTNNYLINIF